MMPQLKGGGFMGIGLWHILCKANFESFGG